MSRVKLFLTLFAASSLFAALMPGAYADLLPFPAKHPTPKTDDKNQPPPPAADDKDDKAKDADKSAPAKKPKKSEKKKKETK